MQVDGQNTSQNANQNANQTLTASPGQQWVDEAAIALQPMFADIDRRVQGHLRRVLDAYRAERVGAHHFAGVTGYGHDDLGRAVLDRVFARVFQAEAAIARVQIVSGTHAIACALYGVLRPGDELLAVAGPPYDTLEEVIGKRGQGQGSLAEWGITYRELPLLPGGTLDWDTLATAVRPQTRVVAIQRSCGYDWRSSLAIADIARIVELVKAQNPNTICFVDNCYGEFVEACEPTAVGADLIAGSLIKNPGGTIVEAGGYVAGKAEWVEAAACRLTAPGIGSAGGAGFDRHRQLFQGLFLAPQMVGEALKGNYLAATVCDRLGYPVNPAPDAPRRDTIQAIQLGDPAKLIAFCRAIQQWSPIDSYVVPEPAQTPGYDTNLIMAAGTFIEGSTSELSADGPLRDPYVAYFQGGTHWTHAAIALAAAIDALWSLDPDVKLCSGS